jgi:uncharacterized membrane protein
MKHPEFLTNTELAISNLFIFFWQCLSNASNSHLISVFSYFSDMQEVHFLKQTKIF